MSNIYDVVIIGGGGAGLTAALYTARAELKTVVFEKSVPGGQIAITDMVENYPGFPEGIMGPDISSKIEEQAKKNGAEIRHEEITAIAKEQHIFTLTIDGSATIQAKSVICAMGATARMINVPGEKELIGKGVSYCATCDAPFFRNKVIAVIGGGDAAIQEALFLTKFAQKLYVVHRRDQLRAGPILQARAMNNEKIEFVWDSVVDSIVGSSKVEKIVLKNVKTKELNDLVVDGVFVFIGHDPSSPLVKDVAECDSDGYIVANTSMQTSVLGMFACGEVRHGAAWQLIAACGEGCQAALAAQHYIEEFDNSERQNV